MAKRRERPAVNPLLKDRVNAIVAAVEVEPADPTDVQPADRRERTTPEASSKRNVAPMKIGQGRATVQVKARFSRKGAEEIERFTRTLSTYLGTTVKGAEITRALWSLAIRSGDNLADLSPKAPKLDRPSNGDRLSMAEFEDAIALHLHTALRSMR